MFLNFPSSISLLGVSFLSLFSSFSFVQVSLLSPGRGAIHTAVAAPPAWRRQGRPLQQLQAFQAHVTGVPGARHKLSRHESQAFKAPVPSGSSPQFYYHSVLLIYNISAFNCDLRLLLSPKLDVFASPLLAALSETEWEFTPATGRAL